MKSWYERFGFSKPTGGLFDGEAEGNIAWSNELQQKRRFGQSTTVTPVQMIQAQSAFLIKGICLNRGLWIVLKIQFPKDVLSRRKRNCRQTNYCFYRK